MAEDRANEFTVISQNLSIISPKQLASYPIPCAEWELIKSRIKKLSCSIEWFTNLGFLCLGACLSTFIAIITGTFSDPSKNRELTIAWGFTIGLVIVGVLLCIFSIVRSRDKGIQAKEIIEQMEVFEARFKS